MNELRSAVIEMRWARRRYDLAHARLIAARAAAADAEAECERARDDLRATIREANRG